MSWHDRWLALDTETTGLGSTARVVEIALVLFQGGVVKESWSQLLHPEGVDWEDPNVMKALEINRISQADLMDKPTFDQVMYEVLDRLASQMVWVAHNAEFDLRMLEQELARVGSFPLPDSLILDTMHLDYYQADSKTQPFRLSSVAERWGVVIDGAEHRAITDATTCGRILHEMVVRGTLPAPLDDVRQRQKDAAAAWKSGRSQLRRSRR